ncbi:putative OsmC-like protein [Amycolatopsis sulphurea]|uniref:Putative OsmC-like protein n=1 Tax=Amycolatopsis sulphurea TaxID=76022 RepID=A0A2A9FF07_9PSEU|nr:OsmC family protein [Amycolatopsis sulphurea]PFG49748.1 putative OsmC-like protein [Amycolatopsis sulphurea]
MTLEVRRAGEHRFVGRNDRGAEVVLGRAGAEGAFSPVELLQIAVAGCSAVTAEELIVRRVGEDAEFRVVVSADRRVGVAELDGVRVVFEVDLAGVAGDVREGMVRAVERAVERLCTVRRTLVKGVPVVEEFSGSER